MQKAVFLDRDGVINTERGEYTFKPVDFELVSGVKESMERLKGLGYLIVVITNQAGIARGIYTHSDVQKCHEKMQNSLPGLIDDVFYSPYYPPISESLARKPGTLFFERAIALYQIDPGLSWMVGDNERDLIPARKLGIKTIGIGHKDKLPSADQLAQNLLEAVEMAIVIG